MDTHECNGNTHIFSSIKIQVNKEPEPTKIFTIQLCAIPSSFAHMVQIYTYMSLCWNLIFFLYNYYLRNKFITQKEHTNGYDKHFCFVY